MGGFGFGNAPKIAAAPSPVTNKANLHKNHYTAKLYRLPVQMNDNN